jgi:hypothetical protein
MSKDYLHTNTYLKAHNHPKSRISEVTFNRFLDKQNEENKDETGSISISFNGRQQ